MAYVAESLEHCIIDGAQGCFYCKFMYKYHCLVGFPGDLDYLKALVDLDEEFPSVNALDSLK